MRNPLAGLGPRQPAQEEAGGLDWGRAARAIFPDQPPEIVDRDFAEELQAGKSPEQVLIKGSANRQEQIMGEYAQRVSAINRTYQNDRERTAGVDEETRSAGLKYKLLGGIGQILQRKDPLQFVRYVDELENAERERSVEDARERREISLGELDAERRGVVYERQDQRYAQGQEDRARTARTDSEAAEILRQAGAEMGISIPEGTSADAILRTAPFLKSALDSRRPRGTSIEDFEARERIKAKYRTPRDKGDFTPNKQVELQGKVEKFDKASRQILQSLDRALDTRINGAKDIELLYNFIARMDNTAAREGELDLAQRAQNLRDRLDSLVGGLTEGQLIGDGLRAQIREQIDITRRQVQEDRTGVIRRSRGLASELGAAPSLVQGFDQLLEYGEESTVPQAEEDAAPEMVRVRAPDGRIGSIPRSAIDEAIRRGGEVVD